MLLCTCVCVLPTFAEEIELTSLSQIKVGMKVKIYQSYYSCDQSNALCCNDSTLCLTEPTSSNKEDDYTWTLEDAGDGLFYLKNNAGYYITRDTCSTLVSSAAKIEIRESASKGFQLFNGRSWLERVVSSVDAKDYYYSWNYDDDEIYRYYYYTIDERGFYRMFAEFDTLSVSIDGIKYGLCKDTKHASVIGNENNTNKDIVIPEHLSYNGITYTVITIGDKAFKGCSSLQSIELPSSLVSIGSYAFYGCSSLESIDLPSSLTRIGSSAFWLCSSLRVISVGLPETLTCIGSNAFYGCSSLQLIDLPSTLETIGSFAFSGCSSLQSIQLPSSIEVLYGVFARCSSLQSIELPSSLVSIGISTFEGCSSLQSIVIPPSVQEISAAAFIGAKALKSIVFLSPLPADIGASIICPHLGMNSELCYVPEVSNYSRKVGYANLRAFYEMPDTSVTKSQTVSLSVEKANLEGVEISDSVRWSSSNSKVATVDANGNVTGVTAGTATISVYGQVEGVQACGSCTVTVLPGSSVLVNSISIPRELDVSCNTRDTIVAAISPSDADNKTLIWKSSNVSVATVTQHGVVKGVSVGTAVITATATDGSNASASCTVTVTPEIPVTISLPSELSVLYLTVDTLVATFSPYNAANRTLTWSSSNDGIATVTQDGVVKGIHVGTAVITATTTDGSKVSASCTVTVTPVTISLPSELSVVYLTEDTLAAAFSPYNVANETLTWSSSNDSIASVTQEGVVKGIHVGTAVITATANDDSYIPASCTVTVAPVPIELSTKTINLQRGSTYSEQVISLKPEADSVITVKWKTLDATVATVASDGTITAVAPGVSTIRYSVAQDENMYTDCRIIVYEKGVVYVGGIYYILDEASGTATVTSIYGGKNTSLDTAQVAQVYSGTINIPETIVYGGKMYTVSAIGSYSFNCQNNLQSIYVPRTVTTIEPNAAIRADNLNRVNVADQSQLVNIGSRALQECASLKRFVFDGTTTHMSSIDDAAFKNCKALETVKWADESSIKSIGASAFYGCSVLNNVDMPNSVLNIGKSAFRYNSGLTDIHLSTSLNYIDEYAFGECGFSAITLPESLANIQAGAFINNEHLQEIALPEHLQGLGSAAFENNSALTAVTFRTNIETMTIGNNAFNQCPMLTKVYVSNLKSFAQTNFNNAKANPANTSQHIYDAAGNEIINVVLPTGTKYVNNNAFNGCAYIKSIEMPATMDHLNDNIIMGCSALKDVYCYAEAVPDFIGTEDPADMDAVFKQASLHVLYGKEPAYKSNSWWGRFSSTVGCDAPVVVEKVTSIVLNQTEATLYVDDIIQLSAAVAPATATNKNVKWASSNDDVAVVSGDGYVLATAEGEADITATATDGSGVKATCHIKVEAKKAPVVTIVSIAFEESSVTIPWGSTKQLVVTYNPENATNKSLAWSSAKPAVATVDYEGKVTGISEGKTIITAKTTDGSDKTII